MFTLSSVGMFSTPAVWNSGAISTEEFREVLQQMPAGIVIMAEWNSVRAIISQVRCLKFQSNMFFALSINTILILPEERNGPDPLCMIPLSRNFNSTLI